MGFFAVFLGVVIFFARPFEISANDNDVVFKISERDLIPEGIAYSSITKSFYLSSIHKSKIIKIHEETGEHEDFIKSGEYGFLPGIGLWVDDENDNLWAIASDVEENKYGSVLFQFELLSGDLKQKYVVDDTLNHFFNDLVVTNEGDIYVTDSNNQAIYQVSDNGQLKLYLQSEAIIYPNGIAYNSGKELLYVASFAHGIRAVDIESKRFLNSRDTTDLTRGIDGLEFYRNSLVGVQNGFQAKSRHKIVWYFLNAEGTEITHFEVIDENNAYFDTPTTGVVKNSHFFCIANSQLSNVDQTINKILEPEKLKPTVILKYDLSAPTYQGGFFQAIEDGDLQLIKSILKTSPDSLNLKNRDSKRPLHLAVEGDKYEIAEFLIQAGADVNMKLPNGRTLLHQIDDPAFIKLLVSNGADAHLNDSQGRSALKFKLMYGVRFAGLRTQKNSAISAFLDAGVKFPVEGDEGRYFLHNACVVGHETLTKHLIENGCNLKSRNDSGGSLLHSVAQGGMQEIIGQLVEGGFDIDVKDRYGLTPVCHAAMEGHVNVVKRLVEAGANISLVTPTGKIAADFAKDFGHNEIVKILNPADSSPNSEKEVQFSGKYLGMNPPGMEPEVFAPGVISSIYYDHSAPFFSKNGDEVFWSPVYTSRGDFIFSMKQKNGNWTTPKIEPFCRIGGTYMYPTLSADGQKLFFTSDHALPGEEPGQQMNIWFVERKADSWSDPQLVGFPGGHEYGLSISENGTLYFMADYEDGFGSSDIYSSQLVDGKYQTPENLGAAVNSPYYEDEPFIAPNQSYLLFASLRPQENNEGRLFISTRNNDGSWTEPKNFSTELEVDGDLRFPVVSPDGKYLFFGSNQNGNWDIYWVNVKVLVEYF